MKTELVLAVPPKVIATNGKGVAVRLALQLTANQC